MPDHPEAHVMKFLLYVLLGVSPAMAMTNTIVVEAPTEAIVAPSIPLLLWEIAKCESGQRQYLSNGEVIKNYNTNGTTDYGMFQINSIHLEEAKSLGFDVMTLNGNIGYALHLYEENGTKDWGASKHCHKL